MIQITRFSLSLFLLLALQLILASCASESGIAHDLSERDANEILIVLRTRGIDAEKIQEASASGGGATQEVTWEISVPSEQSTQALVILNQMGLPRRTGMNLLKIFSNTGLVPSETAEQIRYREGLAESIASSIRKMDGILDADVRLSFPKEDPLNPNKKTEGHVTASVYVKHSGVLDDPNSLLIPKIKRLVAASVPGLDFNDVTVIPDRARFLETSEADFQKNTEEVKQYESIWSIVVAKESVSRFRIIFFTFALIVILILVSMLWFIWKISPLLNSHGGFKKLFQLEPIAPKNADAEKKKEEEEKSDEQEKLKEESVDREPEDIT